MHSCRTRLVRGGMLVHQLAAAATWHPLFEQALHCCWLLGNTAVKWMLQASSCPFAHLPLLHLLLPAVRDIRMLRDRYTGEPRGVAYIQFYR